MNFDDPLEQKLAALPPRELPPEWRAEILARAQAAPRSQSKRPPKWLVVGWGLAWAAVIALHFMTPREAPSTSPMAAAPDAPSLKGRSQMLYTFLNATTDLTP